MGKKKMTSKAASRIQSKTAKKSGGKVTKDSFAARARARRICSWRRHARALIYDVFKRVEALEPVISNDPSVAACACAHAPSPDGR